MKLVLRGRRMKLLLGGLGVVVTLLGAGCLNFTTGAGVEHHTQWARDHGLPEPSYALFICGLVLVVMGAATIGFMIGARRNAEGHLRGQRR